MDRKRKLPSCEKTIKVATGIEIRYWKKSSSIRVIFWYQGIECRETLKLEATSSNIKYAERLRGEILNAIERGTFSYTAYFPNSSRAKRFGYLHPADRNITIGELLNEFLEQTKRTQQPSTYATYKKRCQAHLFNAFGDIPVKDLTPMLIRKWISNLQLKAKTVRNILIPLRYVLEQAMNDDIIERNPLNRVVLSKLLNKSTSKSDYVPDPFDIKEINAILNHATGQTRHLFQFAFFTGLRPSELIALEWKDIDWINGLAKIQRAVVERQEKCTKTQASEREVLLLPPAIEALQKQKMHTFMEGKRIFYNPKTQRPWLDDAQIRRSAWGYLLKKAGVRYRNPYQTRHTYASMMLSAGENMLWVAKQMGHRDTEMIIKIYGKWLPDTTTKVGYKPLNDWGSKLQPALIAKH